ncbi:hypothetical protein C1876_16005 [Eggerthella sinensis]|uniref:Uncharacterized protein n=1 Tax=Eggerthella sinensis TaxID=242230 RepID=A0ABX9HFA4_9ACTN|nr:hypothetical protein C1876_16005 [Eggerthella sinensis]
MLLQCENPSRWKLTPDIEHYLRLVFKVPAANIHRCFWLYVKSEQYIFLITQIVFILSFERIISMLINNLPSNYF